MRSRGHISVLPWLQGGDLVRGQVRRPPAGTLTVMRGNTGRPWPPLGGNPQDTCPGTGACQARLHVAFQADVGLATGGPGGAGRARTHGPVWPVRHSRVFTASSRSQPAEERELLVQGRAAGPSAGPASRGALLSASLGAIWTHSPSPTCRGRRHLKLTKGLKTVAPLRISWSAFYTSARMRLFPHFDSFSVLILL